ncbi:hypothetical protein TESG_02253 [Trichophyton tonsurans CBS 112818]|uniref:Uncharacterized protein n=2 Tax=Trichophyton TaxID=5550 RepID=F2PP49_TRIEC|nr:hypothetical protein TESG_02253 [Trichophyton tonsurans CBS 112818]EGE03667.1 hypothetical protein TEQG_02698 [Trichophyton equinum CBS 127.97]
MAIDGGPRGSPVDTVCAAVKAPVSFSRLSPPETVGDVRPEGAITHGTQSPTGSLARTGWMGRQHMLSKIRHLRNMVLEHRLQDLVAGEVPSFSNVARIPKKKQSILESRLLPTSTQDTAWDSDHTGN